jgi:hypothetical protein
MAGGGLVGRVEEKRFISATDHRDEGSENVRSLRKVKATHYASLYFFEVFHLHFHCRNTLGLIVVVVVVVK